MTDTSTNNKMEIRSCYDNLNTSISLLDFDYILDDKCYIVDTEGKKNFQEVMKVIKKIRCLVKSMYLKLKTYTFRENFIRVKKT